MLKKLKKYLVGNDSETYAVSLVDAPAIEEDFMYFKTQEGEKLQVALESDEKHLVAGAILVPNRPIYRNQGGEEFFVEFTSEAIEKMSQDYLKEFRQHNTTVQHEEQAPEVYMVESWLKADMTHDKSVALGLNAELPVGTWFGVFRINNVDIWERIKSGELRGFSVESMIRLEEVDFAKAETNLEADEPQPTPTTVEPAPAVEPQPQVEPTVEPQPTQVEPQPAQVEPQPAPQPVEEPKAEPAQPNPLEELVKSLQSELESLKQSNTDLLGKIADLEKLPSAKPINTNAGNGGGDTYSSWREQMHRML